ncbi:hypothetical protein DB29_00559 [Shouchella clausii]|nr:hypothetical protein DB29_00559 [Shouchella clausii]
MESAEPLRGGVGKMRTFLMMSVCVVFLISIFAGGYEDNPHKQ